MAVSPAASVGALLGARGRENECGGREAGCLLGVHADDVLPQGPRPGKARGLAGLNDSGQFHAVRGDLKVHNGV